MLTTWNFNWKAYVLISGFYLRQTLEFDINVGDKSMELVSKFEK